ncbi:MAG: acyl-CoA reductase, partial [Ginsengibacter sp.]
MNLVERINLLEKLGNYLVGNNEKLKSIKQKAFEKNKWFTEEFINISLQNISNQFLNRTKLEEWVTYYHLDDNVTSKKVGIIMAGNIPLVGFHDFLCVFISGHKQSIKLSEKDNILMAHIIEKLIEWNPEISLIVQVNDLLKSCEAYIAT